ncbi:MAG: sugar ABC transporter permease [Caldilineaceae bacterium]|nr:sugar ABC transporter permease [Caldilineaceae bacterium]
MNSSTIVREAKDVVGKQQARKPSWLSRVGYELKRNHFAYTVMIPLLIHFLLFEFGPFLFSFVLTFMDWKLVGTPTFVGLANWQDSFQDPLVWQALRNTTVFALYYVVPTIVLAFLMALIINTGVQGTKVFKTLVLMPFVTSGVIIAGIWQYIFKGTETGLFNVLLGWFSIPPQIYFSNPQLAMLVLAALSIFRVSGYLMIYYLAGLQSIPTYLYEAADIDGATAWKKTWYITVPLLKPIHFFVAIITTISAFQVFEQMFVITKGGPAFATTTIVYYLYQMGFNMLRLGYATVVAFILFVVIFVLSLIQRWYLGKEVSYY